jgi:hypothetical protein
MPIDVCVRVCCVYGGGDMMLARGCRGSLPHPPPRRVVDAPTLGLGQIAGPEYALASLDLRGNGLAAVQELASSLFLPHHPPHPPPTPSSRCGAMILLLCMSWLIAVQPTPPLIGTSSATPLVISCCTSLCSYAS